MPLIELPRALEDYFAFAETDPTRRGRRFSITLPFLNGDKLERLQWWYHLSPAEESMYEGHGIAVFRAQAIQRFVRHIGRWLEINRLRLHGYEPIPRLTRQLVVPATLAAQPGTETMQASAGNAVAEIPAWPLEKVANG
jgi:hypothetical protein